MSQRPNICYARSTKGYNLGNGWVSSPIPKALKRKIPGCEQSKEEKRKKRKKTSPGRVVIRDLYSSSHQTGWPKKSQALDLLNKYL